MKDILFDFVVMTVTFVLALWVSDVLAKQTLEERRAARRATEIVYQSCLNTCFQGCVK